MGRKTTVCDKQAKFHTRKLKNGEERETMRETEFPLIAVQNNAIRTNYVKTRIVKTLQNSTCRLCGDREETTNHIK